MRAKSFTCIVLTIGGIAFLHVNGIIHRDLKSENILLDEDGLHAKVADLGLAKPRSSVTLTSIAGTIMYLAPEVLTGQGYGVPADVYSFALVRLSCVVLQNVPIICHPRCFTNCMPASGPIHCSILEA